MIKFLLSVKQAASEFIADDCMSSGAAIAYYAIFALPPLLVMVFMIASFAGISPDRINRVLKQQLGIPTSTAENADADQSPDEKSSANDDSRLESVADRAKSAQLGGVGTFGQVAGVLMLIFAATGLFSQLQFALNRAWNVEPNPEQTGITRYFIKRLFSLGMIVVMALLLLLSMIFSALITHIMHFVHGASPDLVAQVLGIVLDNLLTFGLGTLLFAAVFKILPDAQMQWRDTWLGAAVTAGLFLLGKALIAWYMQRVNLGASWGDAAGSIIAILAWLYYTSLIVLFGAELTQVWAKRSGRGTQPAKGARAIDSKRD